MLCVPQGPRNDTVGAFKWWFRLRSTTGWILSQAQDDVVVVQDDPVVDDATLSYLILHTS